MRRITETPPGCVNANEKERGVIAPLAAILMVALMGFGALAVDVGAIYSEKAQLQNGADSAALAVAQACANSPCPADPKGMAASFANGNALDASSNVVSATIDDGTVDVTTATPEGAGGEHFSLYLARVLGVNSVQIEASAQAQFGGTWAAHVVPLAFSKCEAGLSLTPGLQFFPIHGGDAAPSKSKKDPPVCPYKSSSGSELPGGFGWLDDANSDCSVLVNILEDEGWVGSDPGGDSNGNCSTMFANWALALAADEDVEILVPIFDDSAGTGEGAEFKILAFGAISLRGWNLAGGTKTPENYMEDDATVLKTSLSLGEDDRGIYGEFVRIVTLDEAAVLGGPEEYGADAVKLTN